MISSKTKSVVVGLVAMGLVLANVVQFTKTTTLTCPGSSETYVTESKSRGFPLTYWNQSNIGDYPPCEFSGLETTTLLTQSIFINLLIGGAVLVGTHIALDYRRGKK